jgi:hypothetical protein
VDLKELLSAENQKNNPNTVYDLIANIVHDGEPEKGTYRVHINHKGNKIFLMIKKIIFFNINFFRLFRNGYLVCIRSLSSIKLSRYGF